MESSVSVISTRQNSFSHNDLIIQVNAKKGGFLYWSDGYDSRWKAYRNGQEVHLLRANHNFKAIELAQGKNYIEFKYRPYLFIWSTSLFFLTFFVCIFSVCWPAISKYFHFLALRTPKKRSEVPL